MDKATTITDILAVQQRLTDVQGQIEEGDAECFVEGHGRSTPSRRLSTRCVRDL